MKSLEIFSGAGGLAKGLELAGFKHASFIEFNKDACNSLEAILILILSIKEILLDSIYRVKQALISLRVALLASPFHLEENIKHTKTNEICFLMLSAV